MPRVIPCLDVHAGRVVKGVRFQNLEDSGDPAERASEYEAQGADELVVLDVSATLEHRSNSLETVRGVRGVLRIPLTVGGGVRSVRHAGQLLEAGADKVAVNSAAAERPELVGELADRFGSQCTVVSIDARRHDDGYGVVVRSGSEATARPAVDWAREVVERGAGEVLLTAWDRDGTGEGYDLELLAAVTSAVRVPVVASGGVGSLNHLLEGARAGASGLLVASLLHQGRATIADIKATLHAGGVEVRT